MSSATIGEVVRSGRARYIVEESEGGWLHMCYCNCCAPVLHRRTCSGSARSRRPSHLHLGHLAMEATPADAGAAPLVQPPADARSREPPPLS